MTQQNQEWIEERLASLDVQLTKSFQNIVDLCLTFIRGEITEQARDTRMAGINANALELIRTALSQAYERGAMGSAKHPELVAALKENIGDEQFAAGKAEGRKEREKEILAALDKWEKDNDYEMGTWQLREIVTTPPSTDTV